MGVDLSPGKALLRAGVRAIAFGLIPGGVFVETLFEEVATPFCEAAWEWLRGKSSAEQQEAIESLAQLPVNEAKAIAEQELKAVDLPPKARGRIVGYISAVPDSVQWNISRMVAGGSSSMLLSQVSHSRHSLMAILSQAPSGLVAGPGFAGDNEPASVVCGEPEAMEAEAMDRALLPGGVVLEMEWIPGGMFWIGASPDDKDANEDEKPRHQVSLGGFWMGKFPVTQAQWKAVMGSNPSKFQGLDRPVEKVSWWDVRQFLKNTGQGLRLPTEAEWEVAARGGTERPRYGDPDAIGWHGGNSAGQTHPVGRKAANAYGLYDMMGNVWEWCQDAYQRNAYKTRQGQWMDNPLIEGDGSSPRVVRGGSWYGKAGLLRASVRRKRNPGDRLDLLGFRAVRSARRGAE